MAYSNPKNPGAFAAAWKLIVPKLYELEGMLRDKLNQLDVAIDENLVLQHVLLVQLDKRLHIQCLHALSGQQHFTEGRELDLITSEFVKQYRNHFIAFFSAIRRAEGNNVVRVYLSLGAEHFRGIIANMNMDDTVRYPTETR